MERRCDISAAALAPFDLDRARAGRQCRQRLRRLEGEGFLEREKGALRELVNLNRCQAEWAFYAKAMHSIVVGLLADEVREPHAKHTAVLWTAWIPPWSLPAASVHDGITTPDVAASRFTGISLPLLRGRAILLIGR